MIYDAMNCPITHILTLTSCDGYRFTEDEAHASKDGIVVNGKLVDWKTIEFCKSMADERAEIAATEAARAKFARI